MWCTEPPLEEVPCPHCGGKGAFISLHPLYAGSEICDSCWGDGQALAEKESDQVREILGRARDDMRRLLYGEQS